MGLLVDSTGPQGFNSIVSRNDETTAFDWGTYGLGVEELEVADQPTYSGNPATMNCGICGANIGTFYASRVDLTDFKGNADLPPGAWPTDFEISARGCSIAAAGSAHRVGEVFLQSGGNTFGDDMSDNALFGFTTAAGNPLTTVNYPVTGAGFNSFGKVTDTDFGVRWRSQLAYTSASDDSGALDYVFLDVGYKQTGMMMAM